MQELSTDLVDGLPQLPAEGLSLALIQDQFIGITQDFHFLRPEWLYALIPAVLLFAILRYRQGSSSNWARAIDPSLLPYLLENTSGAIKKSPFSLLLVAWVLASLALAGPVWIKTPQPVHEREDALIVILDLTRSMYATDVKPNRLIRAQRKLKDLLKLRDEGVTGLVVFAGDAHTVTPLTDDTNTIIAMIPALKPEIMPAPGSNLAPALTRAMQLFQDAGIASGRILIMTDEIRDAAQAQDIARDNRYSFPISVLAVGTPEGAPVRLMGIDVKEGYLKDNSGNLVIPRVDLARLQQFANLAGGRYSSMTLADDDLAYLLSEEPLLENETLRELERDFDVWFEEGPWLLLLLLPLASLAFRRGWIWCLALLIVMPPESAQASLWDDLWQTRDQQAMHAMKNNKAEEAAQLFKDPAWKGSALYKSENYDDAGNVFAQVPSNDATYNLGNALAKQGKLEEAIDAYSKVLDQQPDHDDAIFNKQLVEELLAQQQEQQQDEGGEEGDENEDKDKSDQQQSQDDEGESDKDESSGEDEQQDGSDEQGDEEKDKEQNPEDGEQDEEANPQMAEEDAKLDEEEQQALQQWLRRVPDDPGGLLRRKFEQQYEDNIREGKTARNQQDADW